MDYVTYENELSQTSGRTYLFQKQEDKFLEIGYIDGPNNNDKLGTTVAINELGTTMITGTWWLPRTDIGYIRVTDIECLREGGEKAGVTDAPSLEDDDNKPTVSPTTMTTTTLPPLPTTSSDNNKAEKETLQPTSEESLLTQTDSSGSFRSFMGTKGALFIPLVIVFCQIGMLLF